MAAVDKFNYAREYVHGSYENVVAVTPHDTNELAYVSRAIMATGAGNIVGITKGGQTVTIAVDAKTIYPLRFKTIKATDTTATGIFSLF